jgi:amidase
VLATPAVASNHKPIGVDDLLVAGEEMTYRRALSMFSALVNFTSHPAIVLPLSEAGGPPPALQLIGPDWSEHRLLGIGTALEQAGIVAFRPPPTLDVWQPVPAPNNTN